MYIPIEIMSAAKGGVGKSTLSGQRCFWHAANGRKVLLVDGDLQGNVSLRMLPKNIVGDVDYGEIRMASLFTKDFDVDYTLGNIKEGKEEGIFILPCTQGDEAAKNANRLSISQVLPFYLRNLSALAKKGKFDVVVIDSPPAEGTLQDSALAIASHVFIVSELTYTESITPTIKKIRRFAQSLKDDAKKIGGIILNKVTSKSQTDKDRLEEFRYIHGKLVLDQILKHRTQINDCSEAGEWIGSKSKRTDAAKEVIALMSRMDEVTFEEVLVNG